MNNIRPNNVTLPSLSKRMQYWKFVIVQLNKYTSLYQKKKRIKTKGCATNNKMHSTSLSKTAAAYRYS